VNATDGGPPVDGTAAVLRRSAATNHP
ncbi:hypothetical protein A2U01_0100368, partial [Trifolium medium]|nr:hypothetical protein [Trifolium medium]